MKVYIIFKHDKIYEIYKRKKKALKKTEELNDEYNMMYNYYIHQYKSIYEMRKYKVK